MKKTPVRIAAFASGRGSNVRAVHQALEQHEDAPARIELCISNNPNPGVFEFARSAGIEAVRLSPRMFETENEYAAELLRTFRRHQIGMIILAGYMRKIPEKVVRLYNGRMLNIHPALLPEFGGTGMYGMNVHRAVIEAGRSESGATVHQVDLEYDTGPIVDQERVPVYPEDTPETLAARVLDAEHRLYPRVVLQWAERLASAPTVMIPEE